MTVLVGAHLARDVQGGCDDVVSLSDQKACDVCCGRRDGWLRRARSDCRRTAADLPAGGRRSAGAAGADEVQSGPRGEWTGAALLVTETAEPDKRARAAKWPQLGAPFGFLLANGLFLILISWLGHSNVEADPASRAGTAPFSAGTDKRTRKDNSKKPSGAARRGCPCSICPFRPSADRGDRCLEPASAPRCRVGLGETRPKFGEHPLAAGFRRIVSGVA